MQRVPGIGTVILVAFGLLSAGACGPVSGIDPQSNYSYPGCTGESVQCPESEVARCVEGLCQAR